MKLRFHNLAIQGFRSFVRDTVFPFPKGRGFFLLDGDNGAGKSSIWGALCWVLYGKTDRGLKAGVIANWDGTELTSVVVEFSVAGRPYALTRTWNPNTLNLEQGDGEPRPVSQEEVDRLIGLDYQGFLNTVLISQFANTFFDLEATDRLKVFGDALDLGYWEEKGDLARDKAKGVSDTLSERRSALEAERGRLETLRESRDRLRKEVAEWEAIRDVKLGKLEVKREDLARREAVVVGKEEEAQWAVDKARERVERLTAVMVEKTARERGLEREMSKVEGVVESCQRDLRKLRKQKEEVGNLVGKCPTCHQNIKTGHTKGVCDRLQLEVEWEEGEEGRQADKLRILKRKFTKVNDRLKELAQSHDVAETNLRQARDRFRKITDRLVELGGDLREVAQEVKHLKTANPLAEELTGVVYQVKTTKQRVEELGEEVATRERELVGWEKWAKWMKELRLWLIEGALVSLEVEVNNALVQLGLDGWEVTFEVEKETKSGGVTKGFHVLVTAPESKKPVVWKAWSGGETQKLRIAGAMALSHFIRSRRGLTIPLEVWDEPTTFIKEDGILDLLTFLQSRAKSEGRQVWLIDHRAHNFAFDGHITVEKTDEGSRVLVRTGVLTYRS